MAKNIRWQIPFVSIGGTHYRIDIYDEGTFTPVTLTGGTSPFTTSEDDSDDYFEPIRTQSGTIEVCTHDEDGNVLITLDDILPANNISRPVRLVSISGNTETIEWQGFLSCEAYDQDYTSIPQIIQLPVISVLEAMASVEVQLDESKAFLRILGHVCNAMKAIETECGMGDMWGSMYLSAYCRSEMLAKYFYNNVYFSTEEQISGDNIVVEVHSISCKDILSQVAQFFGGCWRECGKDLYFEVLGKTNDFDYQTFANVYDESVNGHSKFWQSVSMTTGAQISQLAWTGTDHKRTVSQGAKRVRVTAGLDDFECKMTLQECPVGSLVENPEARQATWGEVHANTNETFYSLAEHKHWENIVKVDQDSSMVFGKKVTISRGYYTSGINYGNTVFWTDSEYFHYYNELFQSSGGKIGTLNYYSTSFMAWMRVKNSEDQEAELISGLLVTGLPWDYRMSDASQYLNPKWYELTESDYIFKQKTPLVFAASEGHFNMVVKFSALGSQLRKYDMYRLYGRAYNRRGIVIAIKWGNKWLQYNYNTSSFSWGSSFATFELLESTWLDGRANFNIPISGFNAGIVTVYLFPKLHGDWSLDGVQTLHSLFITKLELKYVKPEEELLTDRSENVYAQNLGTAFRDEIDTDVDIATDANNTKLATMLWESDGTTTVKLLTLGSATIRPEVDLLNRLATYYGAARQRLDLIVEHPTAAPLPLMRLNGISPDNRKYLPLAEERDWQQEICTIKCFETPTES